MKKVFTWLDKHFEEMLMCVFLSGIVIMMSLHVFFRYVMQSPLTWSEECTRYFFIWFVFSGFSYGIKHSSHIRVNILETLCPRVIPIFRWLQDIATAAFILYMVPAGVSSMKYFLSSGQRSAGLHLPMSLVYGALMFGLIMSIVRLIQKVVLRLMKREPKAKEVSL